MSSSNTTNTSSSSSSQSITRRSGLNIHKIREFELEKIFLMDEFDIVQIVGEGWYGKILLVEHKNTDTEMVLKALPKPYVSIQDFYREFHYGLCLGSHKNIVTTYDVAFETAGFYVFTQEYAPLGDLTSNVSDNGIGELHSKRVARQIASALEHMHSKEVVHRDVKLDNILVCRSDFSRVKLCDFGESRRAGSLVQRRNEWLPYSPPEVLATEIDDTYKTDTTHDIWQFGIVVFICLTGCLPWQKAAADDPRYNRYVQWHNSTLSSFPMKRTPKLFKLVSAKAAKMFRKFLEPRIDRRVKNLSDLYKYLDDRWLAKSAEKEFNENEQDELCPSMYSFHSSVEEKNRLLFTLAQQGVETTVDRVAKKDRIKDWIQSSVITEEPEEDELEEEKEEADETSTTNTNMMNRTPVAGHVSSLRAAKKEREQEVKTTTKDASKKHIDPRTGLVQEGPSEMGPSEKPVSKSGKGSKASKSGKSSQYYNVDSKNQNGHGENGNGYHYDDESNAVSGKLDINIKENNNNNNNNSKNSPIKNSHEEQKSSTPPPKIDAKPPKSKKTSGIRRVFSLGSSSSKNSNSEINDKTPNDDLTSNSNSTAPKSTDVPPKDQKDKNSTKSQDSSSQPRSNSSSDQIQTTHYLVEDSAYGSMDIVKKCKKNYQRSDIHYGSFEDEPDDINSEDFDFNLDETNSMRGSIGFVHLIGLH